MSQVRILHCNNDNKNMGGAYIVMRKLDPYMRQYGYVFDYITMDEFVVRGKAAVYPLEDSKTFSAKLRSNKIVGHIKLPFYVRKILKENPYNIVHIDIDSAWKALLYAIPAKKSGAKVLIHSHATGIDGDYKGIKGALHGFCKCILSKYSDKYIGCSQQALYWLCPKERLQQGEVLVNGIDKNEYFYNNSLRIKTRKELNIEDCFVLCNVGRINDNKNQSFLIDVIKELKKMISSVMLLLVGPYTEEDYNKLTRKIQLEQMNEEVIIIGETDQVNKYLNAADYFVLPSIFEGLSLASIEAQSTGVRCLLSMGTPPEAKVTELAIREPLESGMKVWASIIYNDSIKQFKRCSGEISIKNTMEGMARHLSNIYMALIGG